MECQLPSCFRVLHALWHDPGRRSPIARLRKLVTGIKDDWIDRAVDTLGAAITSAANETAEVVPDLDVDGWTDVLTQQRGPRTGEVHDIEVLRLIRLARRGAFAGSECDNGLGGEYDDDLA